LKKKLEADFEESISDERLHRVIDFMNDRRFNMMGIFKQQKKKPAPFQGSELYSLAIQEGSNLKEKTEKKSMDFVNNRSLIKKLLTANLGL